MLRETRQFTNSPGLRSWWEGLRCAGAGTTAGSATCTVSDLLCAGCGSERLRRRQRHRHPKLTQQQRQQHAHTPRRSSTGKDTGKGTADESDPASPELSGAVTTSMLHGASKSPDSQPGSHTHLVTSLAFGCPCSPQSAGSSHGAGERPPNRPPLLLLLLQGVPPASVPPASSVAGTSHMESMGIGTDVQPSSQMQPCSGSGCPCPLQ